MKDLKILIFFSDMSNKTKKWSYSAVITDHVIKLLMLINHALKLLKYGFTTTSRKGIGIILKD